MEGIIQFFTSYMMYFLMGITLITAAGVVYSKKAIHSVVALLLTMVLIGGIYLMLDAEFIAAVQLLVYAGGIIVLFLFVVLLVALHKSEDLRLFNRYTHLSLGLIVFLMVILCYTFFKLPFSAAPAKITNIIAEGSTEAVAKVLYTNYLLPFEIASVLLLVAMLGAIILTKERVEE